MIKALASVAALLGLLSQPSQTVREEFATLNQQGSTARKSGDHHAWLDSTLQLQTLLHHSPASVKAVARAYAASGDTQHALASLRQFADLDQTDDALIAGSTPDFAALRGLPEYKSIVDRLHQHQTPISHSEPAFILSDPGILAEDIDYDPHSQSFFITSVLEHKIIRLAPGGKASDFTLSPSHWPMLAVKVDLARNLLWATEVAFDNFVAVSKLDWGHSALLCFQLQTGALLRRIEGPAHSAFGDMALAQNGDPIVSDNLGGGIYRLSGNQLTLINGKDFISPQTPAPLPDGEHLFVPDYLRGIGILNLKNGEVTWLDHIHEGSHALSGVDGVAFDRGSLYLTQNGASPERVLRLQLDTTLTQIVSEEIIERATPALGDPTHGVIVGNAFYYIANSGWSELDDSGNLKPGSKLTPARIMRFTLR